MNIHFSLFHFFLLNNVSGSSSSFFEGVGVFLATTGLVPAPGGGAGRGIGGAPAPTF